MHQSEKGVDLPLQIRADAEARSILVIVFTSRDLSAEDRRLVAADAAVQALNRVNV